MDEEEMKNERQTTATVHTNNYSDQKNNNRNKWSNWREIIKRNQWYLCSEKTQRDPSHYSPIDKIHNLITLSDGQQGFTYADRTHMPCLK